MQKGGKERWRRREEGLVTCLISIMTEFKHLQDQPYHLTFYTVTPESFPHLQTPRGLVRSVAPKHLLCLCATVFNLPVITTVAVRQC